MPRYMTFFSYTGEAWSQMIACPGDREEAARAAIESAGGRMESFLWMLGRYDGLAIYSMPSEVAAAACAAAVAASGRIRRQETCQVLGMTEGESALELARTVAREYRPPGAPADWRSEYDQLGG